MNIKIALLLVAFVFSLNTKAEKKLARINDADGYTNVRTGQGTAFEIKDVVLENEFFYCEVTNSQWLEIIALKWTKGNKQLEGYMHKSRVQFIEDLPAATQKQLLLKVFTKQTLLAEEFLNTVGRYSREAKRWFSAADSLAYRTAVRSLERHSDIQYSPMLEILPSYFCRTKDTEVLTVVYKTFWADRGSASEEPGYAIAQCFLCHPELTLKPLKKLSPEEKDEALYKIGGGLEMNWGSDSKEYKKFEKLVESGY